LNVKQVNDGSWIYTAPQESSWFKLQMVTIDMRCGVIQMR